MIIETVALSELSMTKQSSDVTECMGHPAKIERTTQSSLIKGDKFADD